MKRNVLDHEISSLILGELSSDEELQLKARLLEEDGDLNRIEGLKKDDEAFLARFPAQVFSAQVESGIRKIGFEVEDEKNGEKNKEGRMVIGKRIVMGLAVLTLLGFSASSLNTMLESETSSEPKTAIKEVEPRKLPVEPIVVKSFESDLASLQVYVQDKSSDKETFEAFSAFLKTYDLKADPDSVLWVYDKYASLLDHGGRVDLPSPSSVRAEIVKEFRNMSKEEKESLKISKAGIAKSLFMESEDYFLKMTSITLTGADEETLKKNLAEKQTLGDAIAKNLDEVIGLDVPEWSIASYYRGAATYIDSADAVRRSSISPRLSAKQVLVFKKVLETKALKMEVAALERLQKGLAIEGVESHYIGKSRILSERLKAEICPNEEEVYAVHAAVYEIEHGSAANAKRAMSDVGERSQMFFPEVLELKKALNEKTSPGQLVSTSERLRKAIGADWVCLPKEMHDQFHSDLDVESDEISEKLSREDVRSTIEEARPQLVQCAKYENESNYDGTIIVRFSISSSGLILGDAKIPSSLRESDIGKCVIRVVSKLIFPESETNNQLITYPILMARYFREAGGEDERTQKDQVREAVRLFISANFKGAIKACETIEKGCDRILAVSYKRIGDTKNACKYHRLAKIEPNGLDCEDPKNLNSDDAQILRRGTAIDEPRIR